MIDDIKQTIIFKQVSELYNDKTSLGLNLQLINFIELVYEVIETFLNTLKPNKF